MLCTTCRTYENKHGCLPPAPKSANASFMFKPVKAEEEVNSKHGMKTRQSRAPVSLHLHINSLLQQHKLGFMVKKNVENEEKQYLN